MFWLLLSITEIFLSQMWGFVSPVSWFFLPSIGQSVLLFGGGKELERHKMFWVFFLKFQ